MHGDLWQSARTLEDRRVMGMEHVRLQQKITYWSPTMRAFHEGTIVWISRRQDLVAVQSGVDIEFLTAGELAYNPCAPAGDHEFERLPSADTQNRPNQERYLRVLASAYPDYQVCSITVLEGVRTSCRTGARWRVFCQAAVLKHQHQGLLLDVEGDNVWYGGVTVADLAAFADKSWSPYVAVPNQWDALDIPQQEMARIVSDGLGAVAQNIVIPYPSALSIEAGGFTGPAIRGCSSPHRGQSRGQYPVPPAE